VPALHIPLGEAGSEVEPQNCIVIEDSHWGLEAARNAGMRSIAVTNSYSSDYLRPADKIIENLSELSLKDLNALCS
jgi:beta-phosphoglucomutase-like phosphatase (HAD superfamily)